MGFFADARKMIVALACAGAMGGARMMGAPAPPPAPDVSVILQRAEQGDAAAQYRLGRMYYRHAGVPLDYAQAARWFRKAANQGNESAEAALAVLYYRGQGVRRSYAEAARWLGKVALSCFVRTQLVHGRWLGLVAIALLLPIALVPRRKWGQAAWLPSLLCSAGCAAALARELLLPGSWTLFQQRLPQGVDLRLRLLLVLLFAAGTAFYAVAAVAQGKTARPTRFVR